MNIDVSELNVRLADRGANRACPVCTRVDWIVDDTPAAINAADPDTETTLVGVSVPAAILVCRNCGFIRLHSVEVLFDRES
jgi:hypothetical protein